jgi:SET domain
VTPPFLLTANVLQLESPALYPGQALHGINPLTGLSCPAIEVKITETNGIGLFARCNINTGARILCERPLFTARFMSPEKMEPILTGKLQVLSNDDTYSFLNLYNNFPGPFLLSGIFKTNAHPCGFAQDISAVYATISRINHSCLPNAHTSWNENAGHETVYAIKPIPAGEEITIAYDQGGPREKRRGFLRDTHGFECNCKGCFLPAAELQASDARRTMIANLDVSLSTVFNKTTRPTEALRDCRLLLLTLEAEYGCCYGDLSAKVYYVACHICLTHGDQARANVFAWKAYNARILCEDDSSQAVLRIRSIALNPAEQAVFGQCSMDWKSTVHMVPKGLDAAAFEDWLFRGG